MKMSVERIHRDLEMRWFYAVVAGLPLGFGLAALAIGEWIGFLGLSSIGLVFLVCGWPLAATVEPDGQVMFSAPLRRARVGVDNLTRVKIVGPKDYRRHLVLWRRWRPPEGYRVEKFTDAPGLAQAVLRIVNESGAPVKDECAVRLLEKVAARK